MTEVKSHQDDDTPYDQLDKWGKANCRADKLAEIYMQNHPPEITREFPPDTWSLLLDNKPIYSKMKQTLYKHCTDGEIREHWSRKNYFDDKDISKINWKAIGKATGNIPGGQQRWITKHFAHNSATSKVMHRRGERDDTKCPLCEAEVEDTDHVFRCLGTDMEKTYLAESKKFLDWLKKTTEPSVRNVMMEFLDSTRENRPFQFHPTWPPDIVQLAHNQLEYGQ